MAIAVFEANVARFPDSANAYDSLGEAYSAADRKELAIESYERSLKLNPDNANAAERLKILKRDHIPLIARTPR
jgi:cytochrome c-type biogenesis protein CcmH/NrfG